MKPPRLPVRVSLCAITLLFGACESHPDRHAMMEEARHSVPPMAANDSFFDGAIIAHLTLGSDAGASSDTGDDADKGGGRPSGGGGGGRHGGGHGGSGRGMRQSGDQNAGGGGAGSGSMHASAMPPAVLRLRLENTVATALEVEVRDLNSELGNFAVRPDKFTVMPGQSEEPDPMESLLGVDTYSLPVTITLRSGDRTETKVLTLQLVKPPAASSTPPPNPGT